MANNVIHVAFGSKPRPVEDKPSGMDWAEWVWGMKEIRQDNRCALKELGATGDVIEKIDREFEK